MLIFGIDIFVVFLAIVFEKMPVSKVISYVFYCFMNFVCITLFFRPFVFVVFSGEICRRHFLKHNNAKTN